jgi:hypothetical protein
VPQPTNRQRIGNQIKAAMIFARADFVETHIAATESVSLCVRMKS